MIERGQNHVNGHCAYVGKCMESKLYSLNTLEGKRVFCVTYGMQFVNEQYGREMDSIVIQVSPNINNPIWITLIYMVIDRNLNGHWFTIETR